MSEPLSTVQTLDLPGGGLVPFTSAPGQRVRVLYGRVWLTEEGLARDAFVGSGQDIALGSRGLAVIEALGPARVQLIEEVRGPSPTVRIAVGALRGAVAAFRRWRLRAPRPLRGAV